MPRIIFQPAEIILGLSKPLIKVNGDSQKLPWIFFKLSKHQTNKPLPHPNSHFLEHIFI